MTSVRNETDYGIAKARKWKTSHYRMFSNGNVLRWTDGYRKSTLWSWQCSNVRTWGVEECSVIICWGVTFEMTWFIKSAMSRGAWTKLVYYGVYST